VKVFAVDTHDGAPLVFATKTAALKEARRAAREDVLRDVDEAVAVEEWSLVPLTKEVIVRLLNVSGGYLTDHRVVATFPLRKRRGDTSTTTTKARRR
jgi:hypothetical protein